MPRATQGSHSPCNPQAQEGGSVVLTQGRRFFGGNHIEAEHELLRKSFGRRTVDGVQVAEGLLPVEAKGVTGAEPVEKRAAGTIGSRRLFALVSAKTPLPVTGLDRFRSSPGFRRS